MGGRPGFPLSGLPTPIQLESLAMPADDCFRLDNASADRQLDHNGIARPRRYGRVDATSDASMVLEDGQLLA